MALPEDLPGSMWRARERASQLEEENEALSFKNAALELEIKELRGALGDIPVDPFAEYTSNTDPRHPPTPVNGVVSEGSHSESNSVNSKEKKEICRNPECLPTELRAGEDIHPVNYWEKNPHRTQFCTQLCLLSLQKQGELDWNCPNVKLHQNGLPTSRHFITAERLVRLLKQQVDKSHHFNITPFGETGSSGTPFKVTSAAYGYTVVGKGATTRSWGKVSQEATAYRILKKVQGSAVPVFLGSISLDTPYVHRFGRCIPHMLLMGWGGAMFSEIIPTQKQRDEALRSAKEVRELGIIHRSLHCDNVLWNDELDRAFIIDFHRIKLDTEKMEKRLAGADGDG